MTALQLLHTLQEVPANAEVITYDGKPVPEVKKDPTGRFFWIVVGR
jgi:hypothetical protein